MTPEVKYFLEHESAITYDMLDKKALNKLATSEIDIINSERKYHKIHIYIERLINIIFYKFINEELVVMGTIGTNHKKLDHDINHEWFLMTANGEYADYEIFPTMNELYMNLDVFMDEEVCIAAEKYFSAATTIQSYYKAWKDRMEYRFNPETRLCKYLLKLEFKQLLE